MATDQRLCGTVDTELDDNDQVVDRVQEALENAAEQLTNNTDYDYEAYGPHDHHWYPNVDEANDVDVYLNNFGDEIASAQDSDDIDVWPGDSWIIVDGDDVHGYGDGGRSYTFNVSSDIEYEIHLGRAISCQETYVIPDPDDTTKKIIKHNIGHNFDTGHWAGHYRVSWSEVHAGSPMSHSYVRCGHDNENEESEFKSLVCYKGNGVTPDTFFTGVDNWVDNEPYGDGCTNEFRSRFTYSDRAINKIEESTPLPGYRRT